MSGDKANARQYMTQLFSGLRDIHEHKMIHRDIKPQNIMLTDLDTVKIIDFG